MNKVEEYLNEFKLESDRWFNKQSWLEPRYRFFSKFFEKENLQKADWKDFQ
ncbi:MAG: hypothetical protein M3Q56_10645 [Bacteroidota bacterium]|nr:hypothetical protein [Bacteroidota bacterium]